MNPLNDISQVYLEKVANVVEAKKSSKKEKHIKAEQVNVGRILMVTENGMNQVKMLL
jgi:hypothetical protein